MCAKFTLIEPHIHDLRFEPSVSIGDEDAESDQQATADGDSTGKSKPKMAMQGLFVFLVMFATLWIVFSRLTGSESAE